LSPFGWGEIQNRRDDTAHRPQHSRWFRRNSRTAHIINKAHECAVQDGGLGAPVDLVA
jgi:hypothetical protein